MMLKAGARVIVTGRLEQRSWETEQGEKRSVIEIVADDIGPSLRFATAKVERIDRRGGDFGGGGSGGGSGGGGGSRPQPSGGQSAGGQPSGGQASGGGGYDEFGEEPF